MRASQSPSLASKVVGMKFASNFFPEAVVVAPNAIGRRITLKSSANADCQKKMNKNTVDTCIWEVSIQIGWRHPRKEVPGPSRHDASSKEMRSCTQREAITRITTKDIR